MIVYHSLVAVLACHTNSLLSFRLSNKHVLKNLSFNWFTFWPIKISQFIDFQITVPMWVIASSALTPLHPWNWSAAVMATPSLSNSLYLAVTISTLLATSCPMSASPGRQHISWHSVERLVV